MEKIKIKWMKKFKIRKTKINWMRTKYSNKLTNIVYKITIL